MDNMASWAALAGLVLAAAVWSVRYVIVEYEKYLYNRSHGWQ